MSVYTVNFCERSPEHSINATIEANVIDPIYVDELEIYTVLTYHCATYSLWPGPLLIVLYLALNAKGVSTPVLKLLWLTFCFILKGYVTVLCEKAIVRYE